MLVLDVEIDAPIVHAQHGTDPSPAVAATTTTSPAWIPASANSEAVTEREPSGPTFT
jgi:hypothetical protein